MNGKVLITGGFGNLGSWISLYLAKQGYEIYILTRKEKNKLPDVNYRVIECDITNLKELEYKLNIDFDYCVHTASYNEYFKEQYPAKALKINTLGTRNLLEVLSKKDLKNFIYFSTFHVYGINSGIISEDTSLNPKNDYASTHLFAEYYVKQFGMTHSLKYTILRLTNSYGTPTFINSDKWYLVINDLVKSAYEKKKIVLNSNGKTRRDFIYMGDVVKVVDKLLKKEATSDVFNLSSNKSYEIIELAKIVQKLYEEIYQKKIKIEKNKNDQTSKNKLNILNDKLKEFIDFELNEYLDIEVKKIFKLLEKKNEK